MADDDLSLELRNQYQDEMEQASDEEFDAFMSEYGPGEAQGAAEAGFRAAGPGMAQAGQALSAARSGAGALARSAPEMPRAMLHGAIEAAQNTLDLSNELGADQVQGFLQSISDASPIDLGDGEVRDVELPNVENPETLPAQLVEGVTQFLTGFAAGGPALKGMKMLQGVGRGATIGRGMLQGAMSDFAVFDGHEERLSDLIESVPALSNPVTEFLEADDDDPELIGRMKSAIEGTMAGGAVEGILKGVRMVKAGRRAKSKIEAAEVEKVEIERLAEKAGRVDDDLDEALGEGAAARSNEEVIDEAVAASEGRVAPDDIARSYEFGDEGVMVNWGRISSGDDIKAVMSRMADEFTGEIDQTRRGVRSNKETQLSAQQVDAWDALQTRREGQPLNAEQSLAARELWASSAKKLKEVAARAADSPSEGNLFAFRRMMAVHKTIQEEVIAARTETARALQQWKIPAGDSLERVSRIEETLGMTGGIDATRDLASKISQLPPGRWKEMDRIAEGGAMAKTSDALAEVWQNGLLSAPPTHFVNAIGNTMTMAYTAFERAGAARLARVLGSDVDSVQIGEATRMGVGMLHGARDAFRYAAKTMRRGEVTDDEIAELGIIGGPEKVESGSRRRISSEAFGVSGKSPLGRVADTLGPVIRIPGQALGAADTFFKTVNYRGEVYAQSFRQASKEAESGLIAKEDMPARLAQLVNDPSPQIKKSARTAALERTFTNPPDPKGITAGFLKIRARANAGPIPIGYIILPFINTPANLLRFSFQRSPVAPMFREYREAIARGGADAELARTQMAMGTMISLSAMDMAMNGQISGGGPLDKEQRDALLRTGWQPYSVKVFGRWIQYNRLDPLGMTIGLGADLSEIFVNTNWNELNVEDQEEAFALAVGSVGNVAMSKTYMTGMADFIEFMSDPKRYGENYLANLGATFAVPNLAAQTRRVDDPYMRATSGMMDSIKNRIPGLSESLPLRLDLWGRPITYQSGFGKTYDALSPIYSRVENPEPIDQAILDIGVAVDMPAKALNVGGVSLPLKNRLDIYEEYVSLAGNELKVNGMGAKDTLNAIVSGQHPLSGDYEMASDGPEGGKAQIIKNVITRYRSAARVEVLNRHPDLIDEANAELFDRQQ